VGNEHEAARRELQAIERLQLRRSDHRLVFVHCHFSTEKKSIRETEMGIFTSEEFNSLEERLEHELRELYDAEALLTDALPKLAEKASSPALKRAFESHLPKTERHVERLESIFENIGIPADREKCDAMTGLIKAGQAVLDAEGDPNVLDAALIAAAQRAEHYEIAAYGTTRAFARQLGNEFAEELLEQTLGEEKAADQKLTMIAEGSVNPASA
jgi:ferritin-like metal-binding protein YciE